MALFGRRRENPPADPSNVTVTADQAFRCSLCLEEIPRGSTMFLCSCAQMFHGECSPGVFNCPKCQSPIRAPLPELKRGEIVKLAAKPRNANQAKAAPPATFDEALESVRKAWNDENAK